MRRLRIRRWRQNYGRGRRRCWRRRQRQGRSLRHRCGWRLSLGPFPAAEHQRRIVFHFRLFRLGSLDRPSCPGSGQPSRTPSSRPRNPRPASAGPKADQKKTKSKLAALTQPCLAEPPERLRLRSCSTGTCRDGHPHEATGLSTVSESSLAKNNLLVGFHFVSAISNQLGYHHRRRVSRHRADAGIAVRVGADAKVKLARPRKHEF